MKIHIIIETINISDTNETVKQCNTVKLIIKQFIMNDNQVMISILIEIGKLIQIRYVLFKKNENVTNVEPKWLNHMKINKMKKKL